MEDPAATPTFIRLATPDDLDAVTEIERLCFPPAEAASRASFEWRLAAFADHFWLLEEDGRPVSMVNGMVSDEPLLRDEMFDDATLHNEQGAWQMIFGVATVPASRRHGYAARLLERAIADSREQGRAGLVLTCKDHMLPYYAKFGFVNEGVSASVHGGAVWYDMRLTLE